MTGKVQELTITKAKTVKLPNRDEWLKAEYSLKVAVEGNEEVQPARTYLEGVLDGWLNASAPSTAQAPTTQSTTPTKPLEIFLKDLADLLVASENGAFTVFKPRAYLGSDNFAKIASIIRDEGGEYVSAGKDSYFRISKGKIKKR